MQPCGATCRNCPRAALLIVRSVPSAEAGDCQRLPAPASGCNGGGGGGGGPGILDKRDTVSVVSHLRG